MSRTLWAPGLQLDPAQKEEGYMFAATATKRSEKRRFVHFVRYALPRGRDSQQ
jgi:hypothetical protein